MPARGTLAGMSSHPFDQALTLSPLGFGRYAGHTAPAYWNMIGPYGGITAALVLQAVMQHPDRLGEPITLTVNFAGAVPAGALQGPRGGAAHQSPRTRSSISRPERVRAFFPLPRP